MRALSNTACVYCCVLAALVGCGDSNNDGNDATVQGTVTIDGELAPGGTIAFYPVGGGPVAVGAIAQDGSFSLRIGRGNASNLDRSDIPSGDYVATVVATGPSERVAGKDDGGPLPFGPSLVADKYADRETSDLKITVNEGPNVLDLKLDGAWANPPEEAAIEEPAAENAAEKPDPTTSEEADATAPLATEGAPVTPPANEPATDSAIEEAPPTATEPQPQSPSQAEDRPE